MKALSLWQPWASLVAVGAKQAETRHWPAPAWLIGERMAIHAAKKPMPQWLTREPIFAEALIDHYESPKDLPFGALVATAVLERCELMTYRLVEDICSTRPSEHAFGHWARGRFAWWLRDVQLLDDPIPYRGRQGLFDVRGALGQPALVEEPPAPSLFDMEGPR